MPVTDLIRDDDSFYVIDTKTRLITKESGAPDEVVQYDDNSERFTFKIDDDIEGYSLVANAYTRIEIHYVNVGNGTSNRKTNEGVYIVKDLDLEGTGTQHYCKFSWLLSQNGTKLAGTIKFQVHVIDGDPSINDEDRFKWNTKIYSAINVAEGLNCTELVVEKNPDIIQAFEERIANLEKNGGGGSGHTHANKSTLDDLDGSDKGLLFEGELVSPGIRGEGENSVIFNDVEGNKASGYHAFVEGVGNEASAPMVHVEGWGNKASGAYQHVQGRYNVEDPEHKYLDIVGNGVDNANRSNASTLDWQGNAWYAGDVTVGPENKKLAKEEFVTWANLPDKPFGNMGPLYDIDPELKSEYLLSERGTFVSLTLSQMYEIIRIAPLEARVSTYLNNIDSIDFGGYGGLIDYGGCTVEQFDNNMSAFIYPNMLSGSLFIVGNAPNDSQDSSIKTQNIGNVAFYNTGIYVARYKGDPIPIRKINMKKNIKQLELEYIPHDTAVSESSGNLITSGAVFSAMINAIATAESNINQDLYGLSAGLLALSDRHDQEIAYKVDEQEVRDLISDLASEEYVANEIEYALNNFKALPEVSQESNEGQFLRVVNGQWAAASIPIAENNKEGY